MQALRSASQAMPGAHVLVVEDDIRVTSFFAMRLTSWINAIEARHGPSETSGVMSPPACTQTAAEASCQMQPYRACVHA